MIDMLDPKPPAARLGACAARVAAAALLLACALPARAGWWDDAGGARDTTLSELRAAPDGFRDVPVSLRVRFERLVADVNPYFTQFTPAKWQALAVTVRPTKDAGVAAAGRTFERLFVRRGSIDDLRLASLSSGAPLLLRAVVRDTTGGDPWLEVLSLTRDGDDPTPEERAAIQRAERFLVRDNASAAASLLHQVLAGRRLPAALDGRVRGKLGIALYEMRRHAEAQPLLAAGLEADPADRELLRRKQALDEHLAAVATGEREPLLARDVPETARPTDPAPATPPRDPALDEIPLRLPRAPRTLRGPAGLAPTDVPAAAPHPAKTPDAERPTEPPLPPTRVSTRPAPARPSPTKLRPPVPPAGADQPPTSDEPDEDDEPAPPPPVPRRPRLSGPR